MLQRQIEELLELQKDMWRLDFELSNDVRYCFERLLKALLDEKR